MELDISKPTPQSGEDQGSFITRCIPIVMEEGLDQQQAVGKCFGIWSSAKKDKIVKTIVNNCKDKGLFKTWIPLDYDKSGIKIVEKEVEIEGGEKVKRKFLHGVASNTEIDKEDERVSPEFIKKMQNMAVGLNVFLEHDHSLDKTLGTISASGGDDNNFWAETLLEPEEDNENVVKVLKKSKNGIRLGYSIGGRIKKVSLGKDNEQEFLQLDDGDLFEVSVTPMPAGNGTWVTPISKSMKELFKEYRDKEKEASDSAAKETMKEQVSESNNELAQQLVKIFTDPNLNQNEVSKQLEEMIQVEEMRDQMYDLWWVFRDAMHFITFNDDLTPEQKGDKIRAIAGEFAEKIVALSSSIATLVVTIDEALTN